MRPYLHLMRLDKPVGSWLLFWPGAWGIGMACHSGIPDLKLLALFGLGSVVMRGAGCTINDMWDRDIDKQVERTKSRPLAAGTVGFPQALGFLAAQLSVGLAILVNLNTYRCCKHLPTPFSSFYNPRIWKVKGAKGTSQSCAKELWWKI